MLRQQHRFFRSVMVASDTVVVASAAVAAYFVRFHLLEKVPALAPSLSLGYAKDALPIPTVVPIILLTMAVHGLYRPRRDQHFVGEMWLLLKSVAIGVVLSFTFIQIFSKVLYDGRDFSRLQYLAFACVAFLLLVLWRFVFRLALRELRRRGWNLRHVAIVGTGRLAHATFDVLAQNTWTGIKPLYFISHHQTTTLQKCRGLPVLGGLSQLEEILDAHPVSGVLLAVQGRAARELPELLSCLDRHPVDVRIIPDINPRHLPINMAVSELDGMPILSMRESPLAGWGGVAKRIVDVIGAVTALCIFGIPMLVIALLVRLSGDGPVLFRQERVSLNGKSFPLLKFRTMNEEDPELQAKRDHGLGTAAWTRRDDPRVTRLGKVLRRFSLDELPQLFNVLRGEMSLVGPRPERPELIAGFRSDRRGYMPRHIVKAGMTGWAQVNGLRGDTCLDKRLQYDIFYIRNWSLFFDLRILWMTVFRGFVHPNAG
jgi:Undecaprenyl-phosphate glucose phosphotransferase